jgi:hypothetical protein
MDADDTANINVIEESIAEEPTPLPPEQPEAMPELRPEMSDSDAEMRINSMFNDINNSINQRNINDAFEIINILKYDINQVNSQQQTGNSYSREISRKYTDANRELIKIKQDNAASFIRLFTDNSMHQELIDFFPMSQIIEANKRTIYPVLADAYILTERDRNVDRILRDMTSTLNANTMAEMTSFIAALDARHPNRTKTYNLISIENYSFIRPFEDDVAIVGRTTGGVTKYGLINKEGRVLIEPQYDWMEGFLEGLCAVYLNGKWGFVNRSGTLVIPLIYDDIYDPTVDTDFFAYANPNPEHTKRGFYYGFALVLHSNGYLGYINANNTVLGGGFIYERASNFSSDGIASVRTYVGTDRLPFSGLLRTDGTYIVTPQQRNSQNNMFRMIRPIYGGLAGANWYTQNNVLSRGIVNSSGQVIHTLAAGRYDLIQDFSEGLGMVVKNRLIGFIDRNGTEIIPPVFDTATAFRNELSKVSQSGRYGLVRSNGRYTLNLGYDEIHDFFEGLAVIKNNDRYGFVDSTGRVIVEPRYDTATKFSDGVLPVQIGNSWGLVGINGNEVLSARFDAIGDFNDGLAPARFNGRWGYIDKTGFFVIEPIFNSASPFVGGVAHVRTNDNRLSLIRRN